MPEAFSTTRAPGLPARAAIRDRLARRASDPLLRSAYSLMLNVALTSGLGVAFWIAAARMFPSATVGRDSALVSAMLVVSTICQLNFSSGIARFLPIIKLSPARVVLGAYGLSAIASLLGGTAFVLLAPRLSTAFRFLAEDPLTAVVYVVGVVAWGVFALQDSVLTALRRAPWVPLENGVFGVLKIVALPVLLALGAVHAVFVSWVIPMILLLVPVNWLIFRRMIPSRPLPQDEPSPIERFGRRGLLTFMANDYVASIFIQAASTLMPVLVVALLGARMGAYYYVPFTIVGAFDLLFVNITTSMTVEAAIAQARTSELVRATVAQFAPILAAGVVVLVAGASYILLPYGGAYARGGAMVLRLMACASLFRAVVALYAAVSRVEGRASRVLAIQGAAFVLIAGLTVWLAPGRGLEGVGIAWLIANSLTALIVAPKLIRVLRGRDSRLRRSSAAPDAA